MKNWRTTIIGAVIAALIVIQGAVSSGTIEWKSVLIAAAVAAFGYVAKDAGVTGTEK